MSTTAAVWAIICLVLAAIAAEELWQTTKDRNAASDPADRALAGQHIVMLILDLATISFFLLMFIAIYL